MSERPLYEYIDMEAYGVVPRELYEAALAREKGFREALLWISEYPNRTMEYDLSHEGVELAEFARAALTADPPLERSETCWCGKPKGHAEKLDSWLQHRHQTKRSET